MCLSVTVSILTWGQRVKSQDPRGREDKQIPGRSPRPLLVSRSGVYRVVRVPTVPRRLDRWTAGLGKRRMEKIQETIPSRETSLKTDKTKLKGVVEKTGFRTVEPNSYLTSRSTDPTTLSPDDQDLALRLCLRPVGYGTWGKSSGSGVVSLPGSILLSSEHDD